MEGGDDLGAVAGVDVNTAAAEGDEHVLNALFEEDLRGAVRALEIRDGDAGHFLCLDLVRSDEPAALQEFVGDGLIRGGIQDDADAVLLGKLCYGLVGVLIDLELQQNIGGIADALLNGLDVLGRDGAAGARDNDDLVLAGILIDHDEGDARCDVVVIEEKILRHVQLGHDVQCHVRHGIAAQLRDHCHIAAGLMRRDTLIEALAAGAEMSAFPPFAALSHPSFGANSARRIRPSFHPQYRRHRPFGTALCHLQSPCQVRRESADRQARYARRTRRRRLSH